MSENMDTTQKEQEKNQIENLANQFIEALHDLENSEESEADKISMLFAENAVLANAALELSGKKVEGREAIHRFWIEYKSTLGQAHSKFYHVTTGQNAAGLFWTTEAEAGTHYHGATLLQFDETGMISFFRGYYDTREL